VTVETYDRIGGSYATIRRPDPRHAAKITAALGDARSVVNVGAGTGNYEPADRRVVAVEPSDVMVAQRPPTAAPAVRAVAEALPFSNGTFDAGMALLALHHFRDPARGLREIRRVVRLRVVVFTADIDEWAKCWLVRDYFPWMADVDRKRFPSMHETIELLRPARIRVEDLLTPHDCLDGYTPANWRRPEAYLDPAVRKGSSQFMLNPDRARDGLQRLHEDLSSGRWHERNAEILELKELDAGHRLVIAELSG
jgi:SAM-dependent methyltransferase